ncbi:MAG: C45 family peptidase [Bacteroidota bacterium]|nr:C45 family peptidase [Bacteroidota bacterium]
MKKILLVLIIPLIIFSCKSNEYLVLQTKQEKENKTFHEGSLIIHDNYPILTVKGTPYEAGLQYGVLLNRQLVSMDNTVDSLLESYIGSLFIKKWITNIVLNAKIRRIEEKMSDNYIQEINGMAKGSELSLKDLKIIAYFPQLFFKISCTSFIAKDVDRIVHGRNLDWPGIDAIASHPLIVNYNIEGKIPFTNLTFVGYPGVYTGMNHNGLSMSINMNGAPAENGNNIDDYNYEMPLAFKVRSILEEANNLNEVDDLFAAYSSHAWFITVGSKNDNSGAIYELTRGELIKNEMKNDFLFVENLSLSPKGRFAYSPIWMFATSNMAREHKMKELNKRYKGLNIIDKSYEILKNTEYYSYNKHPNYGYSINNYNTIKSCIMDNMNNEIYFSYGGGLAGCHKYLEYDINNNKISEFRDKDTNCYDFEFTELKRLQSWYTKNYSNKKKLSKDDINIISEKIKNYKINKGYKAYLLSKYYKQGEFYKDAKHYANIYIENYPKYFYPYYNKFVILKENQEYEKASIVLKEMLQLETLSPYYKYKAWKELIFVYKELDNNTKQFSTEILSLYNKIDKYISQYFIDERTTEELEEIKNIVENYKIEK